MVTHDPRFTRHAERAIHLFDGRVVQESAEGLEHPEPSAAEAPGAAGAV
jgi:ABC-type siderophore export system fused ATPase/permease subunit